MLPYHVYLRKKYILVTYDFDSSTINVKHTKSRTGPDLLKAYQTIQIVLEQRGLKTCVHFLDNKRPKILKAFMYEKDESTSSYLYISTVTTPQKKTSEPLRTTSSLA